MGPEERFRRLRRQSVVDGVFGEQLKRVRSVARANLAKPKVNQSRWNDQTARQTASFMGRTLCDGELVGNVRCIVCMERPGQRTKDVHMNRWKPSLDWEMLLLGVTEKVGGR